MRRHRLQSLFKVGVGAAHELTRSTDEHSFVRVTQTLTADFESQTKKGVLLCPGQLVLSCGCCLLPAHHGSSSPPRLLHQSNAPRALCLPSLLTKLLYAVYLRNQTPDSGSRAALPQSLLTSLLEGRRLLLLHIKPQLQHGARSHWTCYSPGRDQTLKPQCNPRRMAKERWLHNMLQKHRRTSGMLSVLTALPQPPQRKHL